MATGTGGGAFFDLKRVDPEATDITTSVRIRLPFGIAGLYSESLSVAGSQGLCQIILNVWYAPPSALGPHLEFCSLESTDDQWVDAFIVRGNRHEAPKRKLVSLEPDRWGRSWRHDATLTFDRVIRPEFPNTNPEHASEQILTICCEYINRILDGMVYALNETPQPYIIPNDIWAVDVDYSRGNRIVGRWFATGRHIFWWRGPRHLDQADRSRLQSALSEASSMALPEVLLVAAKRKLAHADYRGAVIEAASAAEVALTAAIRDQLGSAIGIPVAEGIMKAYQTLGGRLRLARTLSLPLPDGDLEKDLVNPRNIIAHGGRFVSRSVADAAIGAAMRITVGVQSHAV